MSGDKRPGRSRDELLAWAELIELCDDDCEVFATTPAMRAAVLEVERELSRLHKVELLCIELGRSSSLLVLRRKVEQLIPGALSHA